MKSVCKELQSIMGNTALKSVQALDKTKKISGYIRY